MSLGARLHRIDALYNVVHVDEKWFNMYEASAKVYLTPSEDVPYRACANKRYIGKVMLLAAVARPRCAFGKKAHFDGKLGIWPVVDIVPAARNSHNRPAGTLETKNVAMDKKRYSEFLIDHVFPAIRAKWPGMQLYQYKWQYSTLLTDFTICLYQYIYVLGNYCTDIGRKRDTIFVQQDNASPHVKVDDAAIVQAGQEMGWDIQMRCQPAKSPDLNVLNLGLFAAIQARQYQSITHGTDALIAAVCSSYNSLPSETIDKCFLTLQKVMECVIRAEGGNDYRLPRVQRLYRGSSSLPLSLYCDREVYEAGKQALKKL